MNVFDKIKISSEQLTVHKVYSNGSTESVIDTAEEGFNVWKRQLEAKLGKPIEFDLD